MTSPSASRLVYTEYLTDKGHSAYIRVKYNYPSLLRRFMPRMKQAMLSSSALRKYPGRPASSLTARDGFAYVSLSRATGYLTGPLVLSA